MLLQKASSEKDFKAEMVAETLLSVDRSLQSKRLKCKLRYLRQFDLLETD